jgi:drug/metabolite transporter (DMT)-like permease
LKPSGTEPGGRIAKQPHPTGRRDARPTAAILALLSVCVFWGATFLWMKIGVNALREVHPGANSASIGSLFLLLRFALAVVMMPLLLPMVLKRLDRAAWKWGGLLSVVFSLGFFLQIFGLTQADVAPGMSAFLTSLYVVATPLLGALILRKLPPRGVLFGLMPAILGAAFIAGPPTGGLSIGAWATIGCAVAFGGHILLTDHATRKASTLAITFVMLVCGAGWMAAALLLSGGAALLEPAALLASLSHPTVLTMLLLCALFATVIALSVLNRWQKELHPSRAAILYTAEPVFAAIISLAAGYDTLSGWLFFGAAMILLANLSAELLGRRRARGPA